jgi:hypothetical protein
LARENRRVSKVMEEEEEQELAAESWRRAAALPEARD